jgi:ABC-type antimicrobial peptide transport system permease subunit
MLNKLLFRNQDRKQLIIAMIGAFLGITFLITSIHYLIKINEYGQGSEILGPNTIIVQKVVAPLSKTDFSEAEIAKIKSESFIQDVKPVVSNNFYVSFQTDDPQVPYFRSEVFIQTVDPTFLDLDQNKWQWEPGDETVPIVLPRDFLVMLNTFASARGIPQVSEEVAMSIGFKFTLEGESGKEWVKARIIGFTNEVSAILVPESFMKYGAEKYSDGEEKKITQLMLSGKESEFGLVEQYMIDHALETKDSQLIVGRLKSVVGTLVFIVLCISIIAVFVSGLVLIQYMQLLMSKNAYEVRTLLRIGYHPKTVIRKFFIYFAKVFGIVTGIGLATFFVFKYFLDSVFEDGGLYIGTSMTLWSIGALALAYLLFTISSFLTAKKGIFKEY